MELVVEVVGVGIIDGSGAAIDGGGGGSRSGVGEHDVAGVHFLLLSTLVFNLNGQPFHCEVVDQNHVFRVVVDAAVAVVVVVAYQL